MFVFFTRKWHSAVLLGLIFSFSAFAHAAPSHSGAAMGRLDYRNSIRAAVDLASEWFWLELREEGQDKDAENERRLLDLERATNRADVFESAQRDPLTNVLAYEERIMFHAERFEYYLGKVLQQGKNLVSGYPTDPAHPKKGKISSTLEAKILALRELQFAYVEAMKYQGEQPMLEKITYAGDKISSAMSKAFSKELLTTLGAGYLGYKAYTGEDSQLAATGMAAVSGGIIGYSCSWLLTALPKSIVRWWPKSLLNKKIAPRFAQDVLAEAFSSEVAAPYLRRLLARRSAP